MATYSNYFNKRSLGLDLDSRRDRMNRIAHVILAEWGGEARRELRSTLPAYLKALGIREITENSCTVELPGMGTPSRVAVLAQMVEFGMGPGGIGTEGAFDVRTFLLRDGRKHVNVPFSWNLALIREFGGTGETSGAGVARMASKLKATTTSPEGRTLWGGRLPSGLAKKMQPHHVSDPLAGLVRKASTFSRKDGKTVVQTTDFRAWRRASWANRDPSAWLHRGIKARRLADRVASRIDDLVREVL